MKLYQIRIIKTAISGYMKWRRSMGVYVKVEPAKTRTLKSHLYNFLSNWACTPNASKRILYRNSVHGSLSVSVWYQRPDQKYELEYWNQELRAWQIFSWNLYETGALKVNKERTERRG